MGGSERSRRVKGCVAFQVASSKGHTISHHPLHLLYLTDIDYCLNTWGWGERSYLTDARLHVFAYRHLPFNPVKRDRGGGEQLGGD